MEINLNILSQLSQSICCDKLQITGATINVIISSLFLKYQASSPVPVNQVSSYITSPYSASVGRAVLNPAMGLVAYFGVLFDRRKQVPSWSALRTKDMANSLSARSVGRAFLRAQRVTGHHRG